MNRLARPRGIPQRKGNAKALNEFFQHGLAEKDITISELSRRSGMNGDTLYRIFNNMAVPNTYSYIRICKALDLNMERGLELLWDGGKFDGKRNVVM